MCREARCATCSELPPPFFFPYDCASRRRPPKRRPLSRTKNLGLALTPSAKDKTSWFGCGGHVAAVMDAVPTADRCVCGPAFAVAGKAYPPMAGAPRQPPPPPPP